MNTEQGLPGSPPTEDEMNSIQDILKRAISAVVGMSQLQADVDMLRSTVAGLQSDSDRLRNHNESLDEALHQSRMTRNDLTAKLAQVELDLHNTAVDRDRFQQVNASCLADISTISDKLHSAEQARDNAELRVMELEDELKAANAKLDAARALFAPEPEPERGSTIGTILPPAAPEMPKVWEEPEPTAIEPIEQAPPRRYLDQWSPGAIWDPEKNAYYV